MGLGASRSTRYSAGSGEADRSRLRELSTIFLAEKLFDPVDGVELDEELKVSIAAQACLPLLGLDLDWYSDWSTIIVTPREYDVRKRDVDEAGVVHEYDDEFSGEAFDLGPVALSRVDVEASGWGDGYNVVIHEMAHKLDGRDGAYDGCPLSTGAWTTEPGARPSARPTSRLRSSLERPAARRGRGPRARRGPRIDSYAAESPDEFFAVACEYFLREARPSPLGISRGVFRQLALFFRRDPTEG